MSAGGEGEVLQAVALPRADGSDVRVVGDASLRICWCCGQPHRRAALTPGTVAHCARCDAVLARGHRLSLESLLALTLAAALLFAIAQFGDMVTVRLNGPPTDVSFVAAVAETWRQGEPLVAAVAAFSAIVAPALLIGLRLYLLVPLVGQGRRAPGFSACLRLMNHLSRWSMVEVLTVSALVSIVRVAGLAQAVPGPALYALCAMTLVLAAMQSAGVRLLWRHAP